MRKGLIGKKLGMTHVFTADGVAVPVTAIEVGPCPVVALRTQARNGYSALQLGFGRRQVKNVTKPVLGMLREANLQDTPPMVIREIRLDADSDSKVGDVLKADVFAKDEFVDVTGQTKGRGFAGVVRRWNFGGGRKSHGGAWTRRTGSIGACSAPGKVYKGRKMPGHMGNVRRTSQNLQVVDVRPESNLILVKGSIPGANGGYVIVRNAVKKH
ncbi:MAG: 50S ribosomal protein L3 [Lentisphaerae bacterium]|jgi:large subunit ribosomal protein L3|nr:50S ribosomal protein L3 [Lentisphaerota bacterium]